MSRWTRRMMTQAFAFTFALLLLAAAPQRAAAQYREIWRTDDAEVEWMMIILGGYILVDINHADGIDKTGGVRSKEGSSQVIVNRRIRVPIPFTGIGIGGGRIKNVRVSCYHNPNWVFNPKEPQKVWPRWEDRLERSGTPAFNPTFEKVYFSGKKIIFYDIDPYTGENHIILDVDLPSAMWMVGDASAPAADKYSDYNISLDKILTTQNSTGLPVATTFTYSYAKNAHKTLGELWHEAGTGLEDSLLNYRGLVWNEHYVLDPHDTINLNLPDTIVVNDSVDSIVRGTSLLDLPDLPIAPIHIVDAFDDSKDSHVGEGTFYIALTGIPLSLGRLRYENVECVYNGKAQTPIINTMTITNSSYVLRHGIDFVVESYANNVNVGTAQMTLRGIGPYFSGTRTIDFIIRPDVDAGVTISPIPNQIYTGSPITPNPTVTLYGAYTLREYVDYLLSYKNNTNAGTATLTVTLVGIYDGPPTDFYFNILPKPLANNWFSPLANPIQAWTGNPIQPIPILMDNGRTLIEGKDYDLTWSNNIEIGHNSAQIVTYGRGNYSGQAIMPFSIAGKPLQDKWLTMLGNPPYTGQPPTANYIIPLLSVANDNVILAEGNDFSISDITFEAYNPDVIYNPEGGNTTDAGTTWRVHLTGQDLYKGSASTTFTIQPKALPANSLQSLSNTSFTYTGDSIRADASVVVMDGDKTLVRNRDYVVYGYLNNLNVTDSAYLSIEGAGNYAGGNFTTFTITQKPLPEGIIQHIPDQTYTGFPITPNIVVKDGNRTLSPAPNTDNLTNTLGNVMGNVDGVKGNVDGALGSVDRANAINDRADAINDRANAINDRADAINDRANAINDRADAINDQANAINGRADAINDQANAINDRANAINGQADAINDQTNAINGNAPSNVKNLTADTPSGDYTITQWQNNTNVGTAYVTIQGLGNYAASTTDSFTILPKALNDSFILAIDTMPYTGFVVQPDITVKDPDNLQTLTEGIDYTLEYTGDLINVETSSAAVRITGIGNYKGDAKAFFSIARMDTAQFDIAPLPDQTYTGKPLRPLPTVQDTSSGQQHTLSIDADYAIIYSNNTNVGTASLTIVGKGNYRGAAYTSFNILPRTIADNWTLPIPEQTSTGDSIQPNITLIDPDNQRTLIPNTDYNTDYLNNIDTGLATANIHAIGNYQGNTTAHFAIAPIHDTIYQDTLYIYQDTLTLHDTLTFTLHDTIYRDTLTLHDTLYQYRDTLTLHDTLIKEIEIYRIDSFYIVIDGQTGAHHPITATARATSYNDVLLLENLAPNQPFTIYTLQGKTYLHATAWTNGTFAIYNLPPATYILHHLNTYSKFTHR